MGIERRFYPKEGLFQFELSSNEKDFALIGISLASWALPAHIILGAVDEDGDINWSIQILCFFIRVFHNA